MLRESDGEDELHRTAQYLARNVILYTHYVGEVSRIVDEHFSKALDQTTYNEQKGKKEFVKCLSLYFPFSIYSII